MSIARLLPALPLLFASLPAFAQSDAKPAPSRDEWIQWGSAVHGGFGSHIAVGILIGQDALKQLNLQRRQVTVTVTEGANAPCACMADGITVATSASAGQKTLAVAPRSADASFLVKVEVRSKTDARAVVYTVPAAMIGPLAAMNPGKTPVQVFEAVAATPPAALFSSVMTN
ncbi:MAG: FmdE family protein [Pseudomonadota bacterium]